MEENRINYQDLWSTSLLNASKEDVDRFMCSDHPMVEGFLKEKSLFLERSHACKTHLLYYKDKIVGFYSLFADYVNLVKSKRNKEGWQDVYSVIGNQHFPAVRLHYLAVDDKYRGQGLGELLLFFALDTCVFLSDYIGFNFVVLEAMERSVVFFQKYKFSKVKRMNDLLIMAMKVEDLKDHL